MAEVKFSETIRECFESLLLKLAMILSRENLEIQRLVVSNLINLLNQQDDERFVKLLNGIDMWGGSGAV